MRIAALLAVAAALGLVPAVSRAAGRAMVFTVAGAESSAVDPCWLVADTCGAIPPWPGWWVAGQRRIAGHCLTRLADGTILLCDGRHLLALGADGRMRRWPSGGARTPVGEIIDADAAPDGSVLVLGRGVARVRPDGTARALAGSSVFPSGDSIAALPDGGAVVTEARDLGGEGWYALVRIDADGAIVSRLSELPPNPRVDPRVVTAAVDVVALPDGALVLAQKWHRRLLRRDVDGRVTVLAGGGRGFRDGARGTDVDLGHVSAVAARADGTLLIGADRGLLRLDRDARIHTLVRAGAAEEVAAVDPRAVSSDGRPASDVRLMGISGIDTRGGDPLVLTSVPGQDPSVRLALIAPIDRSERFAVAVPSRNRQLLLRGHLEIVASRPAVARVQVSRGRRLLASRTVSVRRGRTRIRLRVPSSTETHVVRVMARTAQHAIATHQLAFIPSRTLARRVVSRLENAISVLGVDGENDAFITCRRRTPRRFACTAVWTALDATAHGVLQLRHDGLISYEEAAVRRRGTLKLVFEPLTFDPRPS